MALWMILALWVGASLLLVVGIALGSSLGYRRGWEDRDALEREARERRGGPWKRARAQVRSSGGGT